jgi:hypothetical protein
VPIESFVKLVRPVDPVSLLVDNIHRALADLVGFPEFDDAECSIATTDEFGSNGTVLLEGDAERLPVKLSKLTFVVRKTLADGKVKGVAHLVLEFVDCRATAVVFPQFGVERDVAEDLILRMLERFPCRNFAGGFRDAEAEKLRAEMGRLRDDARTELAEVRTANEEAKQLIASQRETVQESMIKHHAQVFREEGSDHAWMAAFWLVVAAFGVLGLLGVALTFGPDTGTTGFTEQALTLYIFERVTLLSILATILGVAVRLHRASLHNWVVATHRSNALQAYEAFAGATKDKPGADELLAQALATTFAPKDTGYSKVSGAPDASLIFNELVKRVPGGKTG